MFASGLTELPGWRHGFGRVWLKPGLGFAQWVPQSGRHKGAEGRCEGVGLMIAGGI